MEISVSGKRRYVSWSFVAAFLLVVMLAAPSGTSAAEFFHAIDDLPLAPGMTEAVDQGIKFDSPAGRIVTAEAQGEGDIEAVRTFYRKALPPLGWEPLPNDMYRREGEILTLQFVRTGRRISVQVRLVPSGSKKHR